MITYLRLENFRRHEHTELRFDDNHQVVLVAGGNGVGKSTLFEAVLFALYGEGRNGRGGLERLVRKGGELEGMEVEVEFVVADTTYRARRRRDTKVTSAALYGNDHPLVEGPREVSAEVGRILGMDAKGFKLATYAQQKELDGLASMRPGDRGKMLARLLRLDVLTRAKEAARAEFNEQKALSARLSTTIDRTAVVKERDTIYREITELEEAHKVASAAVVELDAALAATEGVEVRHAEATRHEAAAEGRLEHARGELSRITRELDELTIPDEIADPNVGLDELQSRASDVERRILRGEAAERDRAQAAAARTELQLCDAALDKIDQLLADPEPAVEELTGELAAAEQRVTAVEEQVAGLREQYAASLERVRRAEQALEAAGGLDAECDTCGQSISDEHRHDQQQRWQDQLDSARGEAEKLLVDGRDARSQLEDAKQVASDLRGRLDDASKVAAERSRAASDRVELVRRRSVHLDALSRLTEEHFDLDALYAERTEVTTLVNLVHQFRERQAVRAVAFERQRGLRDRQQAARDAVTVAEMDLEGCRVAADLSAAYEERRQLLAKRQSEAEIANGLDGDLRVARERLRNADRELARAQAEIDRRAAVDKAGQIALYSSKVLERLEAEWAQQIRPSLEGSVGELLGRLSDGRFDAVQLDADYNVTVRDDGVFRSLADLSGGEGDLVALAMRLGLAGVVGERHGSGGPGFLILDECFGSQDSGRRESILTALRNLRGLYGQIFLVSHVGGLDDAADVVVEIEVDEDRVAHAHL